MEHWQATARQTQIPALSAPVRQTERVAASRSEVRSRSVAADTDAFDDVDAPLGSAGVASCLC
jgi:hypothetical protein